MSKEKILILYSCIYDMYRDAASQYDNVDIKEIYTPLNNIGLRILRRIIIPIPGLDSFFFGDWNKNLNEYTKIIINDAMFNNNILKYISKKNAVASKYSIWGGRADDTDGWERQWHHPVLTTG